MRARALPAILFFFACAAAACGKKRAEVKAVDEHEGQGATSCLALPSVVDHDVTVGESCALVVERTVVVRAGAKLVVGAGTKLSFEKGAGIRVEAGALVTRGRDGAPVLLTSHQPTPAAGDWAGVRLVESTGTSLLWTTVEHAGGEWAAVAPTPSPSASASTMSPAAAKSAALAAASSFGIIGALSGKSAIVAPGDDHAAVVVEGGVRELSLEHLHVVHAAGGGLSLRDPDALVRMSACDFETNGGWSVETVADAVPLFAGNTFGERVFVSGTVTRSATWSVGVPLIVRGTLFVASSAKPTLTLASGTVLRFAHDGALHVGDYKEEGTLVAKSTTFTSAEDKPKPGDWQGLDLGDAASATSIEDCTVEYATSASIGAFGSIAFGAPPPVVRTPVGRKVRIARTTFKSCDAPAFSGDTDCNGYESSKLHNVSVGQPLCATSPMIGAFGAEGGGLGNVFGSDPGETFGIGGLGYEGPDGGYGGGTAGYGPGGGGSGVGLGTLGSIGYGPAHDAGVDASP